MHVSGWALMCIRKCRILNPQPHTIKFFDMGLGRQPALFDRLSTPRNSRYANTSGEDRRMAAERRLLIREMLRCESDMEARTAGAVAEVFKAKKEVELQKEKTRKAELSAHAYQMETAAAVTTNNAEAQRLRGSVASLRAELAALKLRAPPSAPAPEPPPASAPPTPARAESEAGSQAEDSRARSVLQKRVAQLEVEKQRLQTSANTAKADKAKLAKDLSSLQTSHARCREELLEVKRRLHELTAAADDERTARDEERSVPWLPKPSCPSQMYLAHSHTHLGVPLPSNCDLHPLAHADCPQIHTAHRSSWREELRSIRETEAEQRRAIATELRAVRDSGEEPDSTPTCSSPTKYSFDSLMMQIEGFRTDVAQRGVMLQGAAERLREREEAFAATEAAMRRAHTETKTRLENDNLALQAAARPHAHTHALHPAHHYAHHPALHPAHHPAHHSLSLRPPSPPRRSCAV